MCMGFYKEKNYYLGLFIFIFLFGTSATARTGKIYLDQLDSDIKALPQASENSENEDENVTNEESIGQESEENVPENAEAAQDKERKPALWEFSTDQFSPIPPLLPQRNDNNPVFSPQADFAEYSENSFISRNSNRALFGNDDNNWNTIEPSSPSFGYHPAVRDVRPVIIVPIAFRDMNIHRDLTRIDTIIHGPALPNTAAFIENASLGLFGLRKIQMLPTIRLPQRRVENTIALERDAAIDQALNQGVDLQSFDTNHDGLLTDKEVFFVSIIADQLSPGFNTENMPHGGAVREHCTTRTSTIGPRRSIRFCGKSASFSEYAQYAVITHEMMHMYGAVDLYNHVELGVNQQASLMGISAGPVYLDPYHRSILFGWIAPRSVEISELRTEDKVRCIPLADSTTSMTHHAATRPVILYDRTRGTNEYFMMEYRRRRAPFDSALFDEGGIALWYVSLNSQGHLDRIPIGLTRATGASQLASPVHRFDQSIASYTDGRPLVITPGLDSFIDTTQRSPDIINYATAVLNFPPPHRKSGVPTGPNNDRMLGFPKLWNGSEWGSIIQENFFFWPDTLRRISPKTQNLGITFRLPPTRHESSLQFIEIGPEEVLHNREEQGLPICSGIYNTAP